MTVKETAMHMTVGANAASVATANGDGFTINLSGNNVAQADDLAALAIGPVVTVLPQDCGATTRRAICLAWAMRSMLTRLRR